jgi:hypothetical protein
MTDSIILSFYELITFNFKLKGGKDEKGTVNCTSVGATTDRISEGIGGWKDEIIYVSENGNFVILLCILI